MHADRLLKLAELLEADAANPVGLKFNLGLWGETEDDFTPPSVSCGTSGCAVGLAILSGEFEQYGLINGSGSKFTIYPELTTGETSFDAVGILFDITYRQASGLFSEDYYDGPTTGATGELAVATRIREFVADEMAEAQP